jgi:hypothetical protein
MIALIDAIAAVEAARAQCSAVPSGSVLSSSQSYVEWRSARHVAHSLARLALEENGATIRDTGSQFAIRFAGVLATSTCGLEGVLGNWVVAARKRLIKGETDNA